MKKFLKNISILLVVFAFTMLFKCSEATPVGGIEDKVMVDFYTLSDGKEAILVSPNKSFSAELPISNKDEYKPNRLYLRDLNEFLEQKSIEVASIETTDGIKNLDGKNISDDKTELFTGDKIVDTEGKERTIILCGDADGGRNNICSTDFSVIVHAYLQDEDSKKITEIQRVAANLYDKDDQLNVFDIKSMILKYLHFDGSNSENENKLGNTLLWSWSDLSDDDNQKLITNISFDEEHMSLMDGKTYQLNAKIEPENATNKTLEWSSSDENIATVNSTGLVTACSRGVATITAKAKDGSGIKAEVTISVVPEQTPTN